MKKHEIHEKNVKIHEKKREIHEIHEKKNVKFMKKT